MASFSQIWSAAIADYARDANLNLEDPDVPRPKDVDEMIRLLQAQHDDFQQDTRGGTFTKSLQAAVGPLNFLTGMFGGAAGMMFPPSSQILGAITVLVNAGKQTTGAFDAVRGLFDKLAAFSQRLKVVEKDGVPDALEQILRAILVSMLRIIALATKRTFHLSPGNIDVKHPKWYKFKQSVARPALMTTAEYMRQLLGGGDSDISGAMATLNRLVDEEARMVGAVTMHNTAVITNIAVDIQGLTINLTSDVRRVELKIDDVVDVANDLKTETSAMRSDIGAGFQKQSGILDRVNAGIDNMNSQFSQFERLIKSTASSKAVTPSSKLDLTSTSKAGAQSSRLDLTSKANKDRRRLMDTLKPVLANEDTLERMRSQRTTGTTDWIVSDEHLQAWLDRKVAFTLITGASGSGKSFLAGRIIDVLQARFKQGAQTLQGGSRVSVGYFFSRSRPMTEDLVGPMLKTLAFQVAVNDPAYEKYILSKQSALEGSPSIADLWNILFKDAFSKDYATVYLVIDIEDVESDDWKDSVDEWKELLGSWKETIAGDTADWPLKINIILLSSNDETQVSESLGVDVPTIHLIDSLNHSDIELFVQKKMETAWRGKLLNADLALEVQRAVQNTANGNFLWASMTVEELSSLNREDVIRLSLESMPPDLNTAMLLVFKRLSRQLDEHENEDLRDMLAWVVCSHRVLTVAELDAVLYLRSPRGARVIDLQARLQGQLRLVFDISSAEDMSEDAVHKRYHQRLGRSGDADETESVSNLAPVNALHSDFEESTAALIKRKLADMAQQKVRLKHAVVEDTIKKHETNEALQSFQPDQMEVKVLLGCLDAICDIDNNHPEKIMATATGYCAVWLPDHLHDVDIESVDYQTRVKIVLRLIQVLRDDEVIEHWLSRILEDLIGDVFDVFDEEHKFLKDIDKWLQDPSTQGLLRRGEKLWLANAKTAPFQTYFESIAKVVARRWLKSRNGWVGDWFSFLSAYIDKAETASVPDLSKLSTGGSSATREVTSDVVSESILRQFQIDYEKIEQTDDTEPATLKILRDIDDSILETLKAYTSRAQARFRVDAASTARILEVARWAGFEENALWLERVAETVRTSQTTADTIELAQKAADLDPHNGVTRSYLALAHFTTGESTSQEGDTHALEAIALMSKNIEDNESSLDSEWSIQSRRFTFMSIACDTYSNAQNWDEAIKLWETMLTDWYTETDEVLLNEMSTAAVSYFTTVATATDRYDTAAKLLERFIEHPRALDQNFANVYSDMLRLQPRQILKVIYKTKKFGLLDRLYTNALTTLARYGADGACAALRFLRAISILRLYPDQEDEAVALLQAVIADSEIAPATNDFNDLREEAENWLARVYLGRILVARDRDQWAIVGKNAEDLISLVRHDADGDEQILVSTRSSALTLAAWDRANGRIHRARTCAHGSLLNGLAMLEDDDTGNDMWAWSRICAALLMTGDNDRLQAAQSMLRMLYSYGIPDAPLQLGSSKPNDPPSNTNGELEVGQNNAAGGNVINASTSEPQSIENPVIIAPSPNGHAEADSSASASHVDTATTNGDHKSSANSLQPAGSGEKEPDLQVESSEQQPAEESEKPSSSTSAFYYCDGACFEQIMDADSVWRCNFCGLDFCQACHEAIKTDTLDQWHICGSLHEHIHVPGLGEAWPTDMVKIQKNDSEVLVPVKEWVDDLKKDWGLFEG